MVNWRLPSNKWWLPSINRLIHGLLLHAEGEHQRSREKVRDVYGTCAYCLSPLSSPLSSPSLDCLVLSSTLLSLISDSNTVGTCNFGMSL